MPVKKIQIEGIGRVDFYKRKGNRSVRLSVTDNGLVRVTLPAWAPYRLGVNFVNTKKTWIQKQLSGRIPEVKDGQIIGKSHRLRFIAVNEPSVTTKLTPNEAQVNVPAGLNVNDKRVLEAARRVSLKALKKQADTLLLPRLNDLAVSHDFQYSKARTRQLKSRWGSCTSSKHITLNIFLVQLPWELIDYVMIHELVHTKVMNHKTDFWDELSIYFDQPKNYRKLLKDYKPLLF